MNKNTQIETGADSLKIQEKDLRGSSFTMLNMAFSTIIDARISQMHIEDVDMSETLIDDANMTDVVMNDVNMTGAKINQATLHNFAITNADMAGMTINGVLVSDLFAAWNAAQK